VRKEKLKILVTDDHVLVRRGIRALLEDEPDIGTVGEAETAAQALKRVREEPWDVVIMDIDMPGQSSFQVIRTIKQEKPSLPILILTMYPERQYAMRMLSAGASGYLTKASAPDHLVTAIRKLVEGMAYVSVNVAMQLAGHRNQPKDANLHDLLSSRELDVLRAIAAGLPLAKIADEMHLSPKTITTYRTRVLEKLSLGSNTELVRYALDQGLIR
jgi:two-component system, NarL family, invasion response regulator UvrY